MQESADARDEENRADEVALSQWVMLQTQVLGQDERYGYEAPQGREEVLDPHEDAEIPWWDIQDAIDQLAAARAPGLPILLPALAFVVTVEHIVTSQRVGVLTAGDGKAHGNPGSARFGLVSR